MNVPVGFETLVSPVRDYLLAQPQSGNVALCQSDAKGSFAGIPLPIFFGPGMREDGSEPALVGHGGHVLTKSGFTVFSQLRLFPLL